MQSYCSGQRPSVTADSVLTLLGLLRFLPNKSSRCLRHRRTIRFAAASAASLPLLQGMQSLCPQHRANGRRAGVCRKKPSTRAALRGRESKLRSGQRFLFKASKIKRLLTRIAKTERVTTKPMVKWLLFASAPRTYSRPVSGSV